MKHYCILLILLLSGLSAPLYAQFLAFNVDFLSNDNNINIQSTGSETTINQAYAYPSPANPDTEIGFRITNNSALIHFSLFDQFGQTLYKVSDTYDIGYQRIDINETTLGFQLPVGVYYFFLEHNDTIVSKGSFGVVR